MCTGSGVLVIITLQHGGVPGDVLNSGQQVMFHPHKQASFLPGVLKIEWLEIVPETSFSIPYHSY